MSICHSSQILRLAAFYNISLIQNQGNRVNGRNSGGTVVTYVSRHGLARLPGSCDAEPSKIMGSQARCARRRIAVLCLAIRLWSGCQAGNFLCTETARGRRRATEKSPPPTQCRQRGSVRFSVCEAFSVSLTIGQATVSGSWSQPPRRPAAPRANRCASCRGLNSLTPRHSARTPRPPDDCLAHGTNEPPLPGKVKQPNCSR